MIYLLGSGEGPEWEAATTLYKMILETWPWINNDQKSEIRIITDVKCHGQLVKDIDIVLLGRLSIPVGYQPFLAFSKQDGYLEKPNAIFVKNLCLIIEVKDHDPSALRFIGTKVEVRYFHIGRSKWHSATNQSDRQKYSLINYLKHNHIDPPYVHNLIWLRNVQNIDLPNRPHNIIGGNSTWDLILNIIGQISPPHFRDGKWIVESWPTGRLDMGPTSDILTKTVEPTRLDRVKMDRICRSVVNREWISIIGNKQLIFRGRGGTGKTIILLQLAWKVFEEHNARVLILTYNKALVADLRRLFTLMGLSDDIGGNTIQIQTVHSFIYSMLWGLSIISKDDDFLNRYESIKEEALNYIRYGTVSREDVEGLIKDQADAFNWDYIYIDEAQDWPENERDLLRHLYPPNTFVIADGIDQFVRRDTVCNWNSGLSKTETRTVSLQKSLRMKSGLAKFVTHFASAIGLVRWNAVPNYEATGGRVLVVEGDYFADRSLHDSLISLNEKDGNRAVDMLFCIPPSLANRQRSNENTCSIPAEILKSWGYDVWDGVSVDVRDSYPTSVQQLRIVQYNSCRGLEGWIVVNLGFEQLYDYQLSKWKSLINTQPGVFSDDPILPIRYAARWLMIPLTRAIDTLVIQIGKEDSVVRTALKQSADICRDFVEWRCLD